MASSITTRYPINGSRDFTAIVQITGDTSSELSGSEVIDPADLTGAPSKFKIKSVNYNLAGFTAVLKWDATSPAQALALSQYNGFVNSFTDSGVPIDNNAGTGITGKLIISTSGLSANMWGTIIINGYHGD